MMIGIDRFHPSRPGAEQEALDIISRIKQKYGLPD
jgi:hypothetical protein